MNTSLIPIGVRQGNEPKKPKVVSAADSGVLEKLDDYLREQTMEDKEEKLNGYPVQSPTYRDQNVNDTDSKLGDYTLTTSQQFNLNNDIAAAMAANTVQSKREIWRIEQLNNHSMQLASQFGLVEASKRQHKKGQKVHRLSQQSTWM